MGQCPTTTKSITHPTKHIIKKYKALQSNSDAGYPCSALHGRLEALCKQAALLTFYTRKGDAGEVNWLASGHREHQCQRGGKSH